MPDWKNEIKGRLAGLKLEPSREAEIVEELTQHLDDRYKEFLAGGASDDEASRATLEELSSSEVFARELRRVEQSVNQEPVVLGAGRNNMIADLWQDLRYAAHSLRKHGPLSIAVIATLALGIGISTGVFAFCNAQFLRPPVDNNFDSFVVVYSAYTRDPLRPGRPGETTLEDYVAFRDEAKSLNNLAAFAEAHTNLGQEDQVEARALLVTSNFFSVCDLEHPLMGRLLEPEDCSSANPVVVVGEQLWRSRLSADPQIIGKVLHFNGRPVTVVGVAPTFGGLFNGARAWFPYTLESYLKRGDNLLRPGDAAWLQVWGRLNPGFSHEDTATELRLLASRQDALHPGRSNALTVTNGSWIQEPEWRSRIMVGFAVILAVLTIFVLIVCVNVTTLLLSRAGARRHEIAVRLALGAGRLRLVRMLLTETFLLASLAGSLGLYLAYYIPGILDYWIVNPGGGVGRGHYGTWWSPAPDWRVFGYLTLVTILAGTMAGLTPALQSLKVNLSERLRARQTVAGGVRGPRLYGLLIGTQIALSFFLLCGTGFFVNAYLKALSLDTGFKTGEVLWTRLNVAPGTATNQRNWSAFNRRLAERLAELPGVKSVAFSNRSANDGFRKEFQAPGQAARDMQFNVVSPNYFAALGIPILSGRAIREDDAPCGGAGCSVVVSQQFAREFWPDQNPLGQTFRDPQGNSFEVVGVAGDVSLVRLGGPVDPMLYLPWNPNSPMNPLVRFSGDGATLARVVPVTIREMDSELSVTAGTTQSLRDAEIDSLGRGTQLVLFLCTMAVTLAVIGIYGVVAFAVSQRTKELGIRIALGAQKADIYRAVLGFSGRPIAAGLLVGLSVTVITFVSMAPLVELLKDLNVRVPITYCITSVLLAGVALAAMFIPARRATRVDPLLAIRDE